MKTIWVWFIHGSGRWSVVFLLPLALHYLE
jgi:hypothetical protein